MPGAQGTRTVWVTSSEDDGKTWAPPREITATTKKPGWDWYATGPGVGIQLRQGPHAGRLVIPCDYSYPTSNPDEVVHQYEGPPDRIRLPRHLQRRPRQDLASRWGHPASGQRVSGRRVDRRPDSAELPVLLRPEPPGPLLEQRRRHDLVGVAGRSPSDRAGLPGEPASLQLARGREAAAVSSSPIPRPPSESG